jgi:hypothetical protein
MALHMDRLIAERKQARQLIAEQLLQAFIPVFAGITLSVGVYRPSPSTLSQASIGAR